MSFVNSKVRTPELCCDIIESIVISCSDYGGASFSELERYLLQKNKEMTRLSLKLYLFYLIDHGYLSYGKEIGKKKRGKYFTEFKGFDMMHQVYEECMLKGITVDCTYVAIEKTIANQTDINELPKFR